MPSYRAATAADVPLLASMNRQLIIDEGDRNPMTEAQLARRMAKWLAADHRAVLLERSAIVVGYLLYREEADHLYIRQLYVMPAMRRQSIARHAVDWMWSHAAARSQRMRIDVLVDNQAGRAFWQACGFRDHCLTMEAVRAP